ncbi:MAG: 3-hydroxyacyl-CoA dehydrogenase, partial [Deltaproteobacteria bacterium]|nr:3-hydroxyacyl-CoA dehydrogenase [Deltaproteobacteria bacterium]
DKDKGWDEETPAFRNKLSVAGLTSALAAKPAAFYLPDDSRLIKVGNFADNLDWLAEADLVIEVVVERLEIKRALFEKIIPLLKPGAIVASNTSGLSIAAMSEGFPQEFQKNFLGLHFFNPPRYLRLLEVIPGPTTDPEAVAFILDFGQRRLGKEVVAAKDTPNFIANRIGAFAVLYLFHSLEASGLSIEAVDALTGPVIGHAKSATFRTADLVGLDTLIHVAATVYDHCPSDEMRQTFKPPEFVSQMVERNLLGEKTGAGFYKKTRDEEGRRQILTLDLATLDYRPPQKAKLASLAAAKQVPGLAGKIKTLVQGKDEAGRFSWEHTVQTLIYAANRLSEIADDIVQIDKAVRSGFAWKMGPFQVWDAIGLASSVKRMEKEGLAVPAWVSRMIEAGFTSFYKWDAGVEYYYDPQTGDYKELTRPPQIILLPALAARGKVIKTNPEASLYDLGDGVAGLEFHTKMNSIGLGTGAMLRDAARIVSDGFCGLVIANHATNFSVGANLMMVLFTAQEEEWDELDFMVRGLQGSLMDLKYLDKPVVAAPAGMGLGGGCEICLACDRVRGAAETYLGLVEVGVGVIPAGGGCKELVVRNTENLFKVAKGGVYPSQIDLTPFVARAFETIALAKVAASFKEAIQLGYLRPVDKMTINRDFLIHEAKQTVLALALEGYQPPVRRPIRVMGVDGKALLDYAVYTMHKAGYVTDYDVVVAGKLAWVLTGGDVLPETEVSEEYLLDLEREAFLSLCGEARTQARMEHMLKTGKPLRN